MKTPVRWAGSIALVLCVLAIGLALGLQKRQAIKTAMAMPPPPEMPVPVMIKPVSGMTYRQQTVIIGTVLAPQSIMLSNEVAGTVSYVGFKSGDEEVKQDEVLIELDSSVEQAELLAAQARVRLAQSALARMRQAATARAVSDTEVEEAEAQFDQASAAVAQLTAIVARKTLKAPFRARLGLSNTHLGQFLPSGTEIVSLQSIEDYVFVDFMIPQSAADFVQVGDPIKMADTEVIEPAKIVALDSRADRLSRNLMARASLSPVPASLVPGDSVRVALEYGPPLETVAVPLEAVRRAPMNTFVYVAETGEDQTQRARARTVRLGVTIGQQVSILSGLSPEEHVVADGSFKLFDGALIVQAAANEISTPANSETLSKK